MNAKNCKQCGKLYLYAGSILCRDCMELMEKNFLKVRDYLNKHPDADMDTIAQDTGVERKKIFQMLREGKLQYNGFKAELQCNTCGASINTGYYCGSCIEKLDKKAYSTAVNPSGVNTKRDTTGKNTDRAFHTSINRR